MAINGFEMTSRIAAAKSRCFCSTEAWGLAPTGGTSFRRTRRANELRNAKKVAGTFPGKCQPPFVAKGAGVPSIAINGFEMYFEDRGTGEPLLLRHGGMGIGADWQHVFPEDPAGYRVVVPDLR